MTRDERLRQFDAEIFGVVEGWLGDRMSQMVRVFGAMLDANGTAGDVAEFGVHHGLFLFLLSALRNEGEACIAVDVFDNQDLNIDNSGRGSLAAFTTHLDRFFGEERRFFRIVQRDTMSVSMAEIGELFGRTGLKFLSIDAGHTVQHVRNDLHLAQEIVAPGGIVALDDYMSPHWPGVTEGFYEFMAAGNRRFKPFAYFQNKLFLTTVPQYPALLRQFRAAIEETCGDEVRAIRWKDVTIAGSPCFSFV